MSNSFFGAPAGSSKGAVPSTTRAAVPWVEKYRPKSLDSIAHQDEVTAVLKKSLENQNLPHLLLYGPPGTGKTSTILAMARELFGPQLMKERILELNASDERGINVVRSKVKGFAQVNSSRTVEGYPCPPFKIIILDEADSMTVDAQSALRRTMEAHSKITRFCLICNYISRIIDPLASRCAKFRFKLLPATRIKERLRHVAECEGVTVNEQVLDLLVQVSEGDMRKAITYMQSAHRLSDGDEVEGSLVVDISGCVPKSRVEDFLATCTQKDFAQVQKAVVDLINDGYSGYQLLSQLHDVVVAAPTITDNTRIKIVRKLASIDHKLSDGADEHLQLMDAGAYILKMTAAL